MRKFWVFLVVFPFLAIAAKAQTEVPLTPKAEAFANYSYARLGTAHGFDAAHMYWGWDAAVVGNLNHWAGLMLDFDGHYGKQPVLGTGLSAGTNIHSFLFGPRFTSRRSERYTPFFHTLFGVARVHRDFNNTFVGSTNGPESSIGTAGGLLTSFNDTIWPFAMKVGGGVDVKMSDHVWFRPFEADYLMTRRGGSNINNLVLSAGLTFRSGPK